MSDCVRKQKEGKRDMVDVATYTEHELSFPSLVTTTGIIPVTCPAIIISIYQAPCMTAEVESS